MFGFGRCARRVRRALLGPNSDNPAVIDRWARLFRKLNRIRRLQRLFHNIGMHLQHHVTDYIRKRLSLAYKPAEARQ